MSLTIDTTPVAKSTVPAKKKPIEHKVIAIQKVIKGETYMVMAQTAIELEDEFSNLYVSTKTTTGSNVHIEPPFLPKVLLNLVVTNNILSQCIEAMEVNIDGTGYEVVPIEEGKDIDEKEKKDLTDFFDEPYPGMSFVSMRRKLRRQLESVGYAYLEVLRNKADEIVLYCGGGFRSVLVAESLQKMGYTNVISMDGGMRGWRDAKLAEDKD